MLIIKRYANRKLYDTTAKQYITLAGIADLIRQGVEVRVIDHETGDDLTAVITAQIIFAQEKAQRPDAPLFSGMAASRQHVSLRQSFSPIGMGRRLRIEVERG
jgi:polyhydroxyalkanoate synthesis repressor PhaR